MKTKKLSNGFELPFIGMGTWPMGGYDSHYSDNDDEKDIAALRFGIENDVTHFDTAEIYARGYAEQLLGRALQGYDRSKLTIASKANNYSLASTENLKTACIASLERVGTSYFDIYYVHRRLPEYALKPQMQALEELYEEGLIRNIAVANFRAATLREAQLLCKYPIVANQVHYNLIFRGPEHDGLLRFCQENDVLLVAYRPLELAKLANTGNSAMLELARKYKGWTHAQLAIGWLISQKNVVTIFKSSEITHIKENLKAANLVISPEDIETARVNYSGQIEVSDSVPLA